MSVRDRVEAAERRIDNARTDNPNRGRTLRDCGHRSPEAETRLRRRRGCSKMPTLRFRDQEIAKYLDASDRLQFLGINEIGV